MRRADEYLPSLDNLRALAVGMVVVFHVGQGRVGSPHDVFGRVLFRATELGGWGVDLFFVLSGFLITRILLETRGKPGYFRSFYARRVLRIFPLYYLYLVLLAVALALIPVAQVARDAFERGWPWYALYLTNIKLVYSYDLDPGSVQHLWSLAVEEHFYLLWPAVVALVPPRMLLPLVLGAIVLVAAGRVLWLARGADPFAVHVLTWTRLDALLIGAALAIVRLDPTVSQRLERTAPLLAGGALAGAFVSGPALRYTFVAVMCAAVLARCVATDERRRSLPMRRSSVLGRIGVISYGIYVFHFFFVLTLTPHMRDMFGFQTIGFCIALFVVAFPTWVCAELSFRWVESPALALKRHVPRPK
jgi:peptidoglycan/LPS O-acetylase OafA/YrhL